MADRHPWGDKLLAESAVKFYAVFDWQPMLSEMRLIKSPNEIRLMQQAGQITAFGHIKAMQVTRPNRFEYEIESEILHEFNRHGARSRLTIPLLPGAIMPVFCITPKMINL